jgi:replicative DNA helicase
MEKNIKSQEKIKEKWNIRKWGGVIKTDYVDIDANIAIYPGEIVTIASRPQMGKSAITQQMMAYWIQSGLSIFICDCQRPFQETIMKIATKMAFLDRNDFEDTEEFGLQSKSEALNMVKLISSMKVIEESMDRIDTFDDSENGQIQEWLLSDSRADVVVIDSLQSFIGDTTNLMARIKAKAIADNTVVFVCTGLSRKTDERQGHYPRIVDLPDGFLIEEFSDKILFLVRRELYDVNDKPGMAMLVVAKNNNGRCEPETQNYNIKNDKTVINLSFDKGLFFDYSPLEYMM